MSAGPWSDLLSHTHFGDPVTLLAGLAAVGLVGLVAVATGRGSSRDDATPEHHEQRGRYTTAAPD